MPIGKPAIRPVADVEEEAPPAPRESLVDFRDVVGAVGLAFLVWGVWQVYGPAGWIVLGAAFLLVAWRA